MKHKSFIRFVLAAVVMYSFAFMALVYVVDPLQMYRPAWYPPMLSEEERFQNPGFAKHYEYDTIIIGSSMTQNFVPTDVERVFGGQAMKLSMEGSTAHEQHLIAKLALSTGQVKRVIWGLDYFSMRGESDAVRDDQGPFPFYLYDDNPLNDVRYLYNFSVVRQIGESVYDRWAGEEKETLETLNNWDEAAVYGAVPTFANYELARGMEVGIAQTVVPLEAVQQSFRANVLSLVEAYPEVEFIVYYPPYSILRQQVWHELNPERFANQQAMKRWMFEQFAAYPNAAVHDFQTERDITHDLSVYKDISHHSAAVNQWIVKRLADGSHRVTSANIDRFIAELDRQVSELDPYDFNPERVIVRWDGRTLETEPRPMSVDGVAMGPARGILDAAGASLTWDAASERMTIARNRTTVVLTAGSGEALVQGKSVSIGRAPKLANGRMIVPIADIARLLGLAAEWESSERTLTIVELSDKRT